MNKKLYVGNLPFAAEEGQLMSLFAGDGRQVASIKIMSDRETGRSRGFGFVEMATPEDAQKAIQALNGFEFMGRPLIVNEAREPAPRTGGGGNPMSRRGGFGGGPSAGHYGDHGHGGGGSGGRGGRGGRGNRNNRDRGGFRD